MVFKPESTSNVCPSTNVPSSLQLIVESIFASYATVPVYLSLLHEGFFLCVWLKFSVCNIYCNG